MQRIIASIFFSFIFLGGAPLYGQESILGDIRERGLLNCGVNGNLPGFSARDEAGHWAGLDVDMCRAVAAAVLHDDSKVKYIPLSAKERFAALQDGTIDLLSRNSTWNLTRDTFEEVEFVGVNFYDGQGFMVRTSSGIMALEDLDGQTICVSTGTTTAQNLVDYFESNQLKYQGVIAENNDKAWAQYLQQDCNAYTADRSTLASYLSQLLPDERSQHTILTATISREPLGPAVSHGDNQWADIVRWVLFAMIAADHYRITAANVDEMREKSTVPEVRFMLGNVEDDSPNNLGTKLELSKDWAYQIIRLVGNYNDVYENNVGEKTALGLKRGLNNLWSHPSQPGLMFAPPFK